MSPQSGYLCSPGETQTQQTIKRSKKKNTKALSDRQRIKHKKKTLGVNEASLFPSLQQLKKATGVFHKSIIISIWWFYSSFVITEIPTCLEITGRVGVGGSCALSSICAHLASSILIWPSLGCIRFRVFQSGPCIRASSSSARSPRWFKHFQGLRICGNLKHTGQWVDEHARLIMPKSPGLICTSYILTT